MSSNVNKKLKTVSQKFDSINSFSKSIIKYGTKISFLILIIGTVLFVINQTSNSFDPYTNIISVTLITSGISILAQIIIGALVIDFIFKK